MLNSLEASKVLGVSMNAVQFPSNISRQQASCLRRIKISAVPDQPPFRFLAGAPQHLLCQANLPFESRSTQVWQRRFEASGGIFHEPRSKLRPIMRDILAVSGKQLVPTNSREKYCDIAARLAADKVCSENC